MRRLSFLVSEDGICPKGPSVPSVTALPRISTSTAADFSYSAHIPAWYTPLRNVGVLRLLLSRLCEQHGCRRRAQDDCPGDL